MIELTTWIRTTNWAGRPWLLLGKGPTYSRIKELDLEQYNVFGLNHVVRDTPVDVAHIIDVDVVEDLGDKLLTNCDWLIMPRRPHFRCHPTQFLLLDDFLPASPILNELDRRGRLVWYNLSTGKDRDDSPLIDVRYFSSEAALHILGEMGATTVRTLGIDGGRSYSNQFEDLEEKTLLRNGHHHFDIQFPLLEQIARQKAIDFAPIVEPIKVFVGCDQTQLVAARVLEYSIRKFTSRPVQVQIMMDLEHPVPIRQDNRPRTSFSFYRFMIPQLCNFSGKAIYLDADMLVLSDLEELWNLPLDNCSIQCSRQDEPPEVWKDNKWFRPGRQFSVMLLDCSRLSWNIDEIVGNLDRGTFDYPGLMFDFRLVDQSEIVEMIAPEWNSLEHFVEGRTKLIHFTNVPTQPWKTNSNPLDSIWMHYFREALQAGAIPVDEVERGLEQGWLKVELASALDAYSRKRAEKPRAPSAIPEPAWSRLGRLDHELVNLRGELASRDSRLAEAAQKCAALSGENRELKARLDAVHNSWSWRLGQSLVRPVAALRDRLGKIAQADDLS